MRRPVIAVLLAALATAAAAQGVYKYTDKDGRVVYTDDPKAGGGKAQRVEEHTTTVKVPDPAASKASRELLKQADRRNADFNRASNDAVAAQNALDEAVARQETGVEPIGDERQGRRFRPEYWQRQQALQKQVDLARARLDEALTRRNALR